MRRFLVPMLVAVVAITGAVLAGSAIGRVLRTKPATSQTKSPPLVFADEDLVVGPIPESEQIERELRITNSSSEVATINRFEMSCSCLGVEPASNVVFQPGETKVFRIKLKGAIPVNAAVSSDGLFRESIDLAAVLDGKNGERPQRVDTSLRYTVQQTVQFEPASARLGVISHREPVRVKAVVTLHPPIADVRVLPNPEWNVCIVQKGKNQRELMAEPVRSGVPRLLNENIQLLPIGEDGIERPLRPFQILGEIRPDVYSSPAQILLGRVKC